MPPAGACHTPEHSLLEEDLTADHLSGVRENLHDGIRCDGFARAGLPHNAQNLPSVHREADAVDRLYLPGVGEKGRMQVLYLQDRLLFLPPRSAGDAGSSFFHSFIASDMPHSLFFQLGIKCIAKCIPQQIEGQNDQNDCHCREHQPHRIRLHAGPRCVGQRTERRHRERDAQSGGRKDRTP